MKEIQLTKGMTALVSDEDYDRLSQYKWQASKKNSYGKDYFYATRSSYDKETKKTGMIYMHREIVTDTDGRFMVVDHRNGNTLDNQRDNLRPATRRENILNRMPQ